MTKKKTGTKKTGRKNAKKRTNSGKHGRPKGAGDYQPRGLECRTAVKLSRTNARDPKPGLKRLVLETKDENYAVNLERLKVLINKKDAKLFKLLTPPKASRKKKQKAAA